MSIKKDKSVIRLSYTANEKYQTSPMSWYLHYEKKLREKIIGSALPFGNAFDVAQGILLMEKDLDKAKETFIKLWKRQQINGVWEDLSKTENVRWSKSDYDENILTDADKANIKLLEVTPAWVSMQRKGILMLEAYEEQVLPHLKNVISTQQYVKIENDEGDYIMGYTDLIAEWQLDKRRARRIQDDKLREQILELEKFNGEIIVFDNKTASQKYKDDSVRESRQLGTYLENPLLEHDVKYCGYIVVPKKFRKTKLPKIPIQIIIDEVDPDAIIEIFDEYEDTLQGIKSKEFQCTRDCLKSPWGCAYQHYCDSDGKDITGLIYVGKDSKDGKSSKKEKEEKS